MNWKHPNTVSFLILLFILIFALSIAFFLYKEQPEGMIFQAEDSEFVFPYELDDPARVYYLPPALREVSGLAWQERDRVLAIQDELGNIYVYDTGTEAIVEQINFGKPLDYEGIARVGQKVYVLERDGDLFEIDSLQQNVVESRKYETALSYKDDAEGLAYDHVDGQLLIALKEAQEDNNESGEGVKRLIYSFDLSNYRLGEQPRYYIDQLELGRMIYHKERSYQFKPSGIAVHPQNGYIYVLASVGRLLVVINRSGKLLYAQRLHAGQFPQPEGITFDDAGNLYLASEGQGAQGRLMIFNPTKK